MLLNGGSFKGNQSLGRKTIDLMRTNQIGDLEVWERKSKFGLGFELITEKGTALAPFLLVHLTGEVLLQHGF
jgi:hypothetical protein